MTRRLRIYHCAAPGCRRLALAPSCSRHLNPGQHGELALCLEVHQAERPHLARHQAEAGDFTPRAEMQEAVQ